MKYTYEKPDGEILTLSLEQTILSTGKTDQGGNSGESIGNEPTDPGFQAMYNGD